uniref:Uncharacterized protein n=1 Tax=Ditylenchus dipsaci TaxID=166011 RepID=A0A915CKX0_9BILA
MSNILKVGKFPEDVVFLFASDANFYPSLRAAIASTQINFNYAYKKIIVYDLGGLAENSQIEAFAEHELFIYCDTSVYFFESNYDDYFSLMESGELFDIQFTKNTNHGIRFATHSSGFFSIFNCRLSFGILALV